MRAILVISAVCMQLSTTYGYPGGPQGVGAYAYQDTSGNRYGGTYQLKDGKVYPSSNQDSESFGTNYEPSFVPLGANSIQDLDEFFPEYFRNFENLLQELNGRRFFRPLCLRQNTTSRRFRDGRRAFRNHLEHQKLALNTARKAFDLTSNQAGYIPNFASRFPGFGDFTGFNHFAAPFDMPNFGAPNSAFAGAAAGPGYSHQMAAINPMNMQMPNVDVTNFADMAEPGKPQFYSVSSSSFASSSNVNGKEQSQRGAETVVNNNGKVTKYKVQN